jgi:hypothetical protein
MPRGLVLRGAVGHVTVSKKIAPAAIVALKEALTNLYWYKGDLRSFLTSTLTNPALLSRLDWGDYKRNIVTRLITFLEKRQDEYQADLLRLMTEVARVEDFSHLERLEGGKGKAAAARSSVGAPRKLATAHEALFGEQKRMEERRRKAHEELLRTTAGRDRLEEFKQEYFKLLRSDEPQQRGYRPANSRDLVTFRATKVTRSGRPAGVRLQGDQECGPRARGDLCQIAPTGAFG